MKYQLLLTFAFLYLISSSCQTSNKLLKTASSEMEIQKMINEAEEGTIIQLKKKIYKLENLIQIENKKKLTIDGNGASLILNSLETDVIRVIKSEDIVLKNFMAKHIEPSGPVGCTGNVILVDYCKNIRIEDCELNGSGIVGIASYHSSNLVIKNNHIHNNSEYPIISQNESTIIEGNLFENNGENVIYYEYVSMGEFAGWPPTNKIGEDENNMEGLKMKNNTFKK